MHFVLLIATALLVIISSPRAASAQVPPAIAAELKKLGQGVFPACTAKLYRSMMPANDYNTYWPPNAAAPNTKMKLYPGVTLSRDVSFGKDPKDLVDIFVGDKGPAGNRTVFIFVPGGGGNKIEQQSPEANAFYDNIGRWAAENDMVGVLMQRHGGNPAGQDVATMIDWLQANIAKYKGNPDRMFITAHSAGTGPLGGYIGRPDLYGIGVKGAIFMSGNPVNFNAGGGARGPGGPGGGAPGGGRGAGPGAAPASPSACQEVGGLGGQFGSIRGPSSQMADQGKDASTTRNPGIQWNGKEWTGSLPPAPAAAEGGFGGFGAAGARGRGGAPGGAGGAAESAAPAFTTQDGFRASRAAVMIVWAELDPGVVNGEFPAAAKSMHDELCKLEGPKAKDGVGHCPTMFMAKDHSHMSEVFSIGSPDKTVSGALLRWIKSVQ
jgi:hypothetical protein